MLIHCHAVADTSMSLTGFHVAGEEGLIMTRRNEEATRFTRPSGCEPVAAVLSATHTAAKKRLFVALVDASLLLLCSRPHSPGLLSLRLPVHPESYGNMHLTRAFPFPPRPQ